MPNLSQRSRKCEYWEDRVSPQKHKRHQRRSSEFKQLDDCSGGPKAGLGLVFCVFCAFCGMFLVWKSKESILQTRRRLPDITRKQLSTTVSCSWRANSELIHQIVKRSLDQSRNRPNKHSITSTQF